MQSLLEKKNDSQKHKWSSYWFVFSPGARKLEYYNSKQAFDSGSKPRGGLTVTALFPCHQLDGRTGKRDHRIDVQGPPSHTGSRRVFDSRPNPAADTQFIIFSLSAGSKEMKEEWLRALEACLDPSAVQHSGERATSAFVPDAVQARLDRLEEDGEEESGPDSDAEQQAATSFMGNFGGKVKGKAADLKRMLGGGGGEGGGEGEEALTDSLQFGDVIYLRWSGARDGGKKAAGGGAGGAAAAAAAAIAGGSSRTMMGYLHGDGVCRTRLGAQPLSSKGASAPPNFQECLFRVVPQLLYEAATELETRRSGAEEKEEELTRAAAEKKTLLKDAGKSKKKIAAAKRILSDGKRKAEVKRIQRTAVRNADLHVAEAEAEREAAMNAAVLADIENHSGDTVLYGARVQLQHVRSGKFVTVRPTQARCVASAIKLELVDLGDQFSAFVLKPHFKNRVEGGRVYFRDQVEFESMRHPDEFVHATPIEYDQREPGPLRITEVNLEHATGWALLRYSRPSDPAYAGLRTNTPVRLYHADAQSFLTASANADKSSANPFSKQVLTGVPAAATADKSSAAKGDRHLPYLKHVPGGDPHNEHHQSAKEVWTFELADRRTAAALRWTDRQVRIKHLPSRKYLAVYMEPAPDVGNSVAPGMRPDSELLGMGGIQFFKCGLTDREEDFAATVFRLMPDEIMHGDVLPQQEISLRIMHEFEGHAGRPVWLHNSHVHKTKPRFDPVSGEKIGESASDSVVTCFSASKLAEDTVIVMPALPQEARDIETMRSCCKVADCYTNRLRAVERAANHQQGAQKSGSSGAAKRATDRVKRPVDPFRAELHQHALDEVLLMLLRTVDFVTEIDLESMAHGHSGEGDGDDDGADGGSGAATASTAKVSEAMALDADARAALHLAGPPCRREQKMACDLKLLNKLFSMLQAVVCACPAEHWQHAAAHTLDALGHRPQHLLVHKLTFHALSRICETNFVIQNYFGRQRILIPKRKPMKKRHHDHGHDDDDDDRDGEGHRRNRSGGSDSGASFMASMKGSIRGMDDGGGLMSQIAAKMEQMGGSKLAGARELQVDTFIGATIRQINASIDVGAASCLRNLITDNMNLLETYVDDDTITNFVDLIEQRGPRPEYLRFLTAVSSCRGTPVVSNQAACLHTMWINPDHRARLLLETRAFDTDGRGEATHAKCIPELHWEAEHSDAAHGIVGREELKQAHAAVAAAEEKYGKHSEEARAAIDEGDFLGFDERVNGFSVLFVAWDGARHDPDEPRNQVPDDFESFDKDFFHDNFFVHGADFDLGCGSSDDSVVTDGVARAPPNDNCFEREVPSSAKGEPIGAGGKVKSRYWVPVKNLCWVLDPEYMLYEVFVEGKEAEGQGGRLPCALSEDEVMDVLRADDHFQSSDKPGLHKHESHGVYENGLSDRPGGLTAAVHEHDAFTEATRFSRALWAAYARGYLGIDPKEFTDLEEDGESMNFTHSGGGDGGGDDDADERKEGGGVVSFANPAAGAHDPNAEQQARAKAQKFKERTAKARQLFRLQRQLAEYYLAQIELFAEMCLARHYHTILQLEKVFPYAVLVSCMVNHKLPFRLRAAFTRLLLRLYVDRYPQQRLQIPEMIHVVKDDIGHVTARHYDLNKLDTEHGLIWGVDAAAHAKAVKVNAKAHKKPSSEWLHIELPQFHLDESNKELLEDQRRHYNFPGATKFRLIREFVQSFFIRTAKQGAIVLQRENKNEFMLSVLEILSSLIAFGFFDNIVKIRELVNPLISVLDGRQDRPNDNIIFGRHGFDGEPPPSSALKQRMMKWAAHSRYQLQEEHNELVMKVKTQMCNVLLGKQRPRL
jgi:hypothetical protein